MIALLCFVLTVLAAPFKSKSRLEAENAALRHQLIVLRRKVHGRIRLTNNDRWFFIQLYRWFPSILKILVPQQQLLVHRPSDVGQDTCPLHKSPLCPRRSAMGALDRPKKPSGRPAARPRRDGITSRFSCRFNFLDR